MTDLSVICKEHSWGLIFRSELPYQRYRSWASVSGDTLQEKLGELIPGDCLVLERGTTYPISLTQFPTNSSLNPIGICTDGIQYGWGDFPNSSECIRTTDSGKLAKLTFSGSSGAFWFPEQENMGNWGIHGIELAPTSTMYASIVTCAYTPGWYGLYDSPSTVDKLGDTDPPNYEHKATGSQYRPRNLVFDRILINPSYYFNYSGNALWLEGYNITVKGCYIKVYGTYGPGTIDGACLMIRNADGVNVTNCHFEGASETVFIGYGGTEDTIGHVPRNINFSRCIIKKNADWMIANSIPSKNLIETKGSSSVTFDGCVLDAGQTQIGTDNQSRLITLTQTPRGSSPNPDYVTVQDWTFSNCVIRNMWGLTSPMGYISAAAYTPPDYADQVRGQNLTFSNCLIYNMSHSGYPLALIDAFTGFVLSHTTIDFTYPNGNESNYGILIQTTEDLSLGSLPSPPYVYQVSDSILAGCGLRQMYDGSGYNGSVWDAYGAGTGTVLTNNVWTAPTNWGAAPYSWAAFDNNVTNWRESGASCYSNVFQNRSTADYRVVGNYVGGGSRDASDGTDVGPNYSSMALAMGTRVWSEVNLSLI